MNHSLLLPFSFHTSKLAHDLNECTRAEWPQHFNTKDYSGSWNSIALRSATGRADDIYAHPGTKEYANTPLLDKCSYFRSIIDSFECEKECVRLLKLAPGSVINEHSDPHEAYEHGCFRIHIPITTDPRVTFIIGGTEVTMKAGECWYANFHLPHSVTHNGTHDRVHLVLDCIRNEWSDRLFAQAGYDFEEEKRYLDHDNETKRRMIEQLSLMDTDTARQLVMQLEKELANTQL